MIRWSFPSPRTGKGACVIRHLFVVGVLVLALVSSRVALGQTSTDRTIRVVTTIQPLRGLVEPMLTDAGLTAEIQTLIPPGVSEHGYEMPPSKLAALATADLVVLVGLGMEPQVEKFLKDRPRAAGGKQRRIVFAAEAAGLQPDPHGHDHVHHDHDGDGACDHDHSVDPHVWLDPVLAQKVVSAVAEELRKALNADADLARRIWLAEERQLQRLKDLHARFERTLAPATSRTIVVGHDAWGHLATRYRLTTVAIKGLTATEPTPASLQAAAKAVREQGVSTVFLEPQLSDKAGRRIAEMTGASLAMLDPLGTGDYFAMMNANLEAIAKALGVTPVPNESPKEPAAAAR